MSFQKIGSLTSIAPTQQRFEGDCNEFKAGPIYIRPSNDVGKLEKPAIAPSRGLLPSDRAVRASPVKATSLSELKKIAGDAAENLNMLLSPGQAIDLGRLRQGPLSGYLCRMTNSGDGFVVQTHEQAKFTPLTGMFFPTLSTSYANISMDMRPVTDVDQLPPKMYNALHAISRFVCRQPIESLRIQT